MFYTLSFVHTTPKEDIGFEGPDLEPKSNQTYEPKTTSLIKSLIYVKTMEIDLLISSGNTAHCLIIIFVGKRIEYNSLLGLSFNSWITFQSSFIINNERC